jgi:hypothetical protein
LLLNNIAAGVVNGTASVLFYTTIFVKGVFPPPRWINIAKTASVYWIALLAIISGVMLVVGVIRIRKWFKDKDSLNRMNTPAIIRHAIAFGLYLISTCLLAAAQTLYLIWPPNEDHPIVDKVFGIVYFLDQIMQFIA